MGFQFFLYADLRCVCLVNGVLVLFPLFFLINGLRELDVSTYTLLFNSEGQYTFYSDKVVVKLKPVNAHTFNSTVQYVTVHSTPWPCPSILRCAIDK
jgi:hypothetical protein